jgi:hypothetical protein
VQRFDLLIDFRNLARCQSVRGLAVANTIKPQQHRNISEAEPRLLRPLHTLQSFERVSPVVTKSTNRPGRLRQQATTLVVAHRLDADAGRIRKLANRHLPLFRGFHRKCLTPYYGTESIILPSANGPQPECEHGPSYVSSQSAHQSVYGERHDFRNQADRLHLRMFRQERD